MATYNRIFIAFAIEEEWARIRLGGQAKNERTPFNFIDMSVKEPFTEAWKTQCRARIRGCDGVIALVSKNTATAAGQLWEIQTAKDERVPILGIYPTTDNRPIFLPSVLTGVRVTDWTWANIKSFIDRL